MARAMWVRLETLHAVTYFSDESIAAARECGLKGFWMGYFGFRAAPMGSPSAATVCATFANFAPSMVERAIPDAWKLADPDELIEARCTAAASALRRAVPDLDEVAAETNALLERVVGSADPLGRPLFAANARLSRPEDPAMRLWQLATTLREHRGDSHVQLQAVAGIDGCEVHVLHAAEHGNPPELLRDNRGWTDAEWAAAADRLRDRGLLNETELSVAGQRLRSDLEAETDRLAARPYALALDDDEREHLLGTLAVATRAVIRSGTLPYPNPMGLPRFAEQE